ncbi:MAG: autotransporter domain-containing protein, partial [Phascolarctobacterium sp.]|nr:autotransporter domain-containing protein [Phascolarctobacterium sp.]
KLTVVDGAKVVVKGIDYATYNVATGFKDVEGNKFWTVDNIADLENNLVEGQWLQDEAKNLQLQVIARTSSDIAEQLGVSETTASALNDIVKAANAVDAPVTKEAENVKSFASAIANATAPEEVKAAADAIVAVSKMAEAGGGSATAAKVVANVTGVTNQRMSFSGAPNAQKGGHGVGLIEEGSGAAIWAQYVHGKDTVEDMPSTAGASSYTGQYNGIVMGVDFKKVGKFQSGVAFNYGEGDTNSVGNAVRTSGDYDFWGVGYYGNIRNEDTNFIFDVNYAKSDSDVTQNSVAGAIEASPETTTWSAGVKVEKLYQNENVQIVPYTGLRFMSIDTDSYKATNGDDTLFNYAPERQDIWLLPLGVSIKQEVVNDNGWVVTPKVDLSYIWAFGDTDSEMTVAIPGVSATSRLGYTVMDEESWLGVVGLEAAKGDWTFGVSYSYQKGDHSENEKWYVDAKYSF